MMNLKLGKLAPVYDKRDLLFASYRTKAVLPPVPNQFGHENLIKISEWGMNGNDKAGDCVFAGAAHETELWNRMAGKFVSITAENSLADYGAVTGYNPVTGANDNGTNVRDAMKYRKKTGVIDSAGVRHKIGAYLSLEPGNWQHLLEAMYLFGMVGIGIEFPASAMDQFNAGKPWSVVATSSIEGGHYIPLVAERANLECVTWGRLQGMTRAFYAKYCDEAWVMLSTEMLNVKGMTLEGFDLVQLKADLKLLP